MTWSHNDMWMLTADHGGYVKYWQSNMNNVKMFQAHKEAIREARSIPHLPFSVVHPSVATLVLPPPPLYRPSATGGRRRCRFTCFCSIFVFLVRWRRCIDLSLIFLLLLWLLKLFSYLFIFIPVYRKLKKVDYYFFNIFFSAVLLNKVMVTPDSSPMGCSLTNKVERRHVNLNQ